MPAPFLDSLNQAEELSCQPRARNIRRRQSFSRMWMKRFFSVGVLLVAAIGGAAAQSSPSANGGQKCTPSEAKPHEGTVAPREGSASQGGATLGDKLAQSDGVICPPANVDPEMRAPAPKGGPMPVIPPPGSPGGDQTIRPK